MAIFNVTGSSRQRPLRSALSRFLTSKVRGIFEVSEGQRPAEVFYPVKYLPVRMLDTELQDGIVILKGTVVSALPQHANDWTTEPMRGSAVGTDPSGVMPRPSGTIYTGISQTTSTGLTANIDDDYYGYDESVVGLLTIANGGSGVFGGEALEQYGANDVTVGTITSSGVLAANGDASTGREPNFPIGVVTGDVYQDIRGKYLNYDIFDKIGILSDWYIEVPFIVDTSMIDDGATARYNTCANGHAFLWAHSVDDLRPGVLIATDRYGKFVPQYDLSVMSNWGMATNWVDDTAANRSVVQLNRGIMCKTPQTVGRLIALDSRWPKDHLELVDTYPGSLMPGTETGGLPSHLFTFVRDYLIAVNATTPTIRTIVETVTGLTAGVARIQLEIGA